MRNLSSVAIFSVCAIGLAASFHAGLVNAAVSRAEYDAAIFAARQGDTASAIQKLQAWHSADPKDMRIVYDLAAIHDSAGDYPAAMAYAQQILESDAPDYAIKAVAHAAKSSAQWQVAETAYQRLLNRAPDDGEAHAGLIYAWIGQKRVPYAFEHVTDYFRKAKGRTTRKDLPLLIVLAELHELRKEWISAAAAFQEVLLFDPGFRYAIRGRVFALGEGGLAYLAKRLAEQQPTMFSTEEHLKLAHAAAAHTIRFGQAQLAADATPARFNTTDVALKENEAITQDFGAKLLAKFDRMVALRDRERMPEVVAMYETLLAERVALPHYAALAAADAYLALRKPEAARDIYFDVLKDRTGPDSSEILNWKISLMYSYAEAEQHEDARQLAEATLAKTPPVNYKGIPGMQTPNPEHARIDMIGALLQMYADRLNEAEKRISAFRTNAPFNSEVRSAWAALQSSRERPRAALEEYSLLLVDEPESTSAAIGRGETLLSLHEFAQARVVLPELMAEHPENAAVQSYARKLHNYDLPTYRIEARSGSGATAVGAETVIDATVHSGPLTNSLGDRYRVFGHAIRTKGLVADESVSRSRLGVGIDYRSRDMAAEVEVNRSAGSDTSSGIVLAMSRDLSDSWHVRAALDTNIIDLPAAALRDGVTAGALKLGLTWTLNESRQGGAEVSGMRFSDGNIRNAARAWWKERLISGPIFKLDAIAGLSGSTNSASERNYFNPVRDTEAGVEFKGEWLTWRRYQRSFKQRLSLSVGQYWQAGYDRGAAADMHYEHEWNRDDLLGLQYGLGRSFHPYDGLREFRNYFYLNLYGRIQ